MFVIQTIELMKQYKKRTIVDKICLNIEQGKLVFGGIFVLGYFAIWVILYSIIKKRTKRLNEIWRMKHQKNS